jgi:hypothetical protein
MPDRPAPREVRVAGRVAVSAADYDGLVAEARRKVGLLLGPDRDGYHVQIDDVAEVLEVERNSDGDVVTFRWAGVAVFAYPGHRAL